MNRIDFALRSCALYNSYIDPLLNPHLSNNSRDQMKWMVWEMKQIFNAHVLCMLGFWLSSDIARRITFLVLVYEGVFSEKFNGRLWYENNYHNYCCINLIVHILRRLNFNHCHIYILYARIRERFHAIYDGIFEIAMNLKTVNNRMSRAGEIHIRIDRDDMLG